MRSQVLQTFDQGNPSGMTTSFERTLGMHRKSSVLPKFNNDVASDESLENASGRGNRSHTQGVTAKKEDVRSSGQANASKRTGRLRSISLGSGFSKLKEDSENAKVKKKNTKGNLKNGDSPSSGNSSGKYSEENITRSREANFKYLLNSNASPFVKFLSKFTTPNPGKQRRRSFNSPWMAIQITITRIKDSLVGKNDRLAFSHSHELAGFLFVSGRKFILTLKCV